MDENTVFIYENSIGKLVFKQDSPFWITDIDGVSGVEIDIAESRSSRQIGSSVVGQSVRPRTFTIDGAIFEPLGTNRDRVIDVVAPEVNSTFKIEKDNKSWYLDVVPEKTPEIEPGVGVQHFQTRLYAAYPYWRTTESLVTQIAGLNAMFRFPFFTGGNWWVSKFSDSLFKEIENDGNVKMEFQIVFTARSAIVNPELYHVGTRKRILIRKAMVAGERVIVSTFYGKKGVVHISPSGEVTNGFRYLSKDSDLSMSLLPGSNLLRVNASTNREGLHARIVQDEGVKSGA